MQHSLENVISKLQKTYQLKTLELENIKDELELRKIAIALSSFKDPAEISSYDVEKIKTFLTKSGSDLDLEAVSLACTIVCLASSIVKESKRYKDCVNLLSQIKDLALSYAEVKEDLFLKQTQYETLLNTMEDLFRVLTNKVVVDAEDLDIYIKLLETEIFKDDKYAVLVVVAALVMRNANLLANPEKIEIINEKSSNLSNYSLTKEQEKKRQLFAEYVNKEANNHENNTRGMITNTYLKNIEVLIEKKKISFDEAKTMLDSDPGLYEYFLWNWMSKLVNKLEHVTSSKDANNVINQLEEIKENCDELVERKKIRELVKNKVNSGKTIIYQVTSESELLVEPTEFTEETIALINQLRSSKEMNKNTNISNLDNNLEIITGAQEFILFKKLPKNHIVILMCGKIEDMGKRLDTEVLAQLSSEDRFKRIKKAIADNDEEYKKIIKESENLESKFLKKDI